MFPLSTHQLARLLNTTSADAPLIEQPISRVVIDSRLVQPGDVFFAIEGRQTHGVEFAADAITAGAAAVVTDRISAEYARPLRQRTLVVPDTVSALQFLARWNRSQSDAAVIGITGSVGKTSTRQLIAAVLGTHAAGCQSPANYNNELGVPLTLLQLRAEHRFAAVEMGAGRAGDIRILCELARPVAAVVTRVAPCHLESFGDLQSIARTKAELPTSLESSHTAFLNADDPLVCGMVQATAARVVFFGEQAAFSSRLADVHCENGRCRFRCGSDSFSITGPRQLVLSAAAAVAVGREWGLTPAIIQQGLDGFLPEAGRGRVTCGESLTVIDESYNCSPASLQACIRGLGDWTGSRRVLVAGEMLELGGDAERLHRETAATLADSKVNLAVFTGRFASVCCEAAVAAGFPAARLLCVEDQTELPRELLGALQTGDIVLVKGSRALQLEKLVRVLLEYQGQPGPQRPV
ncbi:MAG: UDP-N-acetylmuramoyl-tripeptide--D-alanyl-D-alanine ligase [Planctomycetota bacterium]